MKGMKSFWISILYVLGLLCVYVGERLIATGTSRAVWTAIGLVAVLAALVWRFLRAAGSQGESPRVERLFAKLYGLGAFALLLYFVQSDVGARLFGKPLDQVSGDLAVILSVAWPIAMATSLFPVLLCEFSYASMAEAPKLEFDRVRSACLGGLGLAFALVFVFCCVFVASKRDVKWDFSYSRTAKPGDSTRKLVRGLEEPLFVSLFFPPASEVREEVAEYFSDLSKESPNLKVENYDKDVDVAKARELSVSGNGAVVISRGGRKEQWVLSTRLESARTQLSSMDQEIQKRILGVSKSKRTLYFVVGHGERSDEKGLASDQRSRVNGLKELFRSQNYEMRNLGAAEGLGTEVPKDAAAILLLGPTSPLLPEEMQAILRYLQNGGRALIALDNDSPDMSELLTPLGLKAAKGTLANDKVYLVRSHQNSDRSILVTASFSSHPSVTSLSQLGPRAPLILVGASGLESGNKPDGVTVDFTVHSHVATWNDLNSDFQFDAQSEARKAWELAAAVTLKKAGGPGDAAGGKDEEGARVIVVGDVDALTDLVLPNAGNGYFALDALRWLGGDESIAGPINKEIDAPIEHTRKQDVVWFYSTIFLAPVLVLAVGFVATRRRRRSRKNKEAA
jgi:hypothetical protein